MYSMLVEAFWVTQLFYCILFSLSRYSLLVNQKPFENHKESVRTIKIASPPTLRFHPRAIARAEQYIPCHPHPGKGCLCWDGFGEPTGSSCVQRKVARGVRANSHILAPHARNLALDQR